ncbi:MAG: hypothetical protein L3V56_00435 [Candidatus Magnetoovum sp. WYHC-5]|nr:hypothetical protein [Candidatus Magnetoovum sp. WYHC-5]
MINLKNFNISTIAISSVFGFQGTGLFPYSLFPPYINLLKIAKDLKTTIFTKSATRFARRGNFILHKPWTWKYIRRIPKRSMLNAYGLTNGGVEVHALKLQAAYAGGYSVVPNFYPEFSKGTETACVQTLEAMEIYKAHLEGLFLAVELNFSCPNSKEDIANNMDMASYCIKAVKEKYPQLSIIAKTSIVHPYEFYEELERLGVDAIHAVNSVPYDVFFPNKKPPFRGIKGAGLSGAITFERVYDYNRKLRKRIRLPLIMGCGVTNVEDVARLIDIGANAVSICSIVAMAPNEAIKIIKGSFHN